MGYRNANRTDKGRRLGLLLAALLLAVFPSGCPLVVLGLMSGPIALGGAVTGTALGARTAYYNLRDFYDAVAADQKRTPEQRATLEALRLIDIYRTSYKTLDRTVSAHGFTPEEFVLLKQLARRNGQRDQELKENLNLQGLDLDETLRNLQKRRWVQRRQIERAATFVFYAATDAGLAALENARPPLEHMRFEYLRRLSLDDRRDLTRLIAKSVGEEDSPVAGSTGGVLGLSTEGEAEFLLAKHIVASHWLGQKLLAEHGVTDIEFQVISSLWLSDQLGPRSLIGLTQLRREEFEALINALVKEGYVLKAEQVSEEGPYLLRPGPRAEEFQKKARPLVDASPARLYPKLNPDERTRLIELVAKMSRGIVG
ncbi:MAG: MarR family winged helix-turn-helix transcriptional regulator [Bdellovibrionota bacterium]